MSVAISGTAITFPDASTQNTAATGFGFKNRIINGAMVIDQRNAGAAITLTAAGLLYPVDRFFSYRSSGTTGATAQQISSGITGGKNAVRIQRTVANTATDSLIIGQVLETNNSYDLAGQNITLSFQARCGANFSAASSQITARIGTGTGTDQSASNFANNAWTGQSNTNTAITLTTSWQTFTITIAAGSSVTQAGILFYWTPSGTAGAADYVDITGVQLEKGSTATSFDYRPYGTELALCQRYYVKTFPVGTAPAQNAGYDGALSFISQAAQLWDAIWRFPVNMRIAPTTVTTYSPNAASSNWSTNVDSPAASVSTTGSTGICIRATTPGGAGRYYAIQASASAEL